ncbi:glycoside hydrolase family 88 protein [Paenibacillus sp. 2TAB23]|uniref:glycoside hydrolase family 88 protein n=1 Tax=Paenibacillus sp. 2TAB23 TaxID=3233004 RepID=UPI003F9CC02B
MQTNTMTNYGGYGQAVQFALERIHHNLSTFTELFPSPASEGLVYAGIVNEDWTASFWTGQLWLAYELTGGEQYRNAAERQLPSFKKRARERIAVDTHDLGFLYSLSAVAEYRITGNEEARAAALLAADLLAERYFAKAGIIQAWGDLNDPEQCGRMIIDCLMNLPLLYWASEETGNGQYAAMARSHVKQSAVFLVRPDFSTYHTYYMDVETGEPKYGNTHQGYADDSCWARGQAWGIYGFMLSYAYTRDEALLGLSKSLADYFLTRLPEDGIVYWDLIFTEGTEQEKDSSAAAIAVCGLLELVKHLPKGDPDRQRYEQAALTMLSSLSKNYTTKGDSASNGILQHAVYNKPRGMGVDECTIWGDYFYVEALARVMTEWRLYW